MLDAQDLAAIADLLDQKLEEKLEAKLEEKLDAKLEEKLDAKLEEKLETKFVKFKNEILEETDKRLDARIRESEKRLLKEMNKRLEARVTKCERNLLTEMERLYKRTNEKIAVLDERVDKLEERYNEIKLENSNTALIMQMITTLQKDVEEIKFRIA